MDTREVSDGSETTRLGRRANKFLIVAAAFLGGLSGFGSVLIFTFGVFLKPLTEAFGWSRSQISLAFTLTALSVAFCSPVIGRLLDRFPARRIVLPCVAIYGTAFASLSLLTGHLWHLLGLFVLMGIVGNGSTQLGYARVISAWFDKGRGRAFAIGMAGSATGAMVWPPVAQALIANFGWRSAYAILGALILLLGIPLTAAVLYEPENEGAQRERMVASLEPHSHARTWTLIRSRNFLLILGALLLFSISTNGLNTHLMPLLTDEGLTAGRAAGVLSLLGFASLVSRLGTGYLLDRFSATKIAALLFSASAAGMLVLVVKAGPALLPYVGVLLLGVGMGSESDIVPYLLSRYFGLLRFSELYAYTWSAYALAGAMGPLALASAFDVTLSYTAAVIVFSALVVGSAVCMACLGPISRGHSAFVSSNESFVLN